MFESEEKEDSENFSAKKRRTENKSRFSDLKLIPRIRIYLEGNKNKQYIDIDDMASTLHGKYPEYGRRKLKQFRNQVSESFEQFQRNSSASGQLNGTLTSLYESPKCSENKNENNNSFKTIKSPQKELSDYSGLEGKRKIRKNGGKSLDFTESKMTFADFGGNDNLLKELCLLLFHLKHPEIYKTLGVCPPKGFLLHGPPGCGKTLLAHAIAGELQIPFLKVPATEIVSGVSGDSENKIRELFDKASASAPCILFIDEIDSITSKRETAQKDMERRIVAQILMCIDDLTSSQVLLIGATNRPDSLDPALRRAGRFDREIALGIPDEKARTKILSVIMRGINIDSGISLEVLARKTPGYVGADLNALLREASINSVNRLFKSLQNKGEIELHECLKWLRESKAPLSLEQLKEVELQMSDFETALQVVQPSSKREGFATVPDVTWNDVGALKEIREELDISILGPVNHPEKFEELGLCAPAGILLCGPPGCGKTLLAKAVANQAGINFISVKGPELINMYVGESERGVRQVFQRARHSAPCVIFFDELDALCPRRSSHGGDGGSSSRVVNQLLTEMDGMESRKNVFLMAATNRVDIIDPAILRPGRLDKILFIDLPSLKDREEILRAITKNGTKPNIDSDVDFKMLALDFEGYSGADMSALVREASVAAFKEYLNNTSKGISVMAKHFKIAQSKLRPSVSDSDRKKYSAMRKRYMTDSLSKSNSLNEKQNELKEGFRFLEGMIVRVTDTDCDLDYAGEQGVISNVTPDNTILLTLSSKKESVCVSSLNLEPFTPSVNEKAKLLIYGSSTASGMVLKYNEDEDDVTFHIDDKDISISLDFLCKVV